MVVVGGVVVVGATVVGHAVVSGGIAASLPEPLVNAVEQPTSAIKPKTMPHPMRAVRRSAGATGPDDTWGAVPADCIHGTFAQFSQFFVQYENARRGVDQGVITSTAADEVRSFYRAAWQGSGIEPPEKLIEARRLGRRREVE